MDDVFKFYHYLCSNGTTRRKIKSEREDQTFTEHESGIIGIHVINDMRSDSDCVARPEPVWLKDDGILASMDHMTLDHAYAGIIDKLQVMAGKESADTLRRLDWQHGPDTIDWAEEIGSGSKKQAIADIDR